MRKTKILTKRIPGDIIHLFGYYPSNPPTTTEHPRPIYKPVFIYPKPSKPTTITSSNAFSHHTDQQHHQQQSHHRPTWEHETNHISSPSFYPLVHPDEHFGIIDDDGFGSEAEAAVFSHNNYGDYSNKPTTYADDDYRPFQGIVIPQNIVFGGATFLVFYSFLLCLNQHKSSLNFHAFSHIH